MTKTSVFVVRHGHRGIVTKVKLANGDVVPLQNFSLKALPLYAYPAETEENIGNLSGEGWKYNRKLGKLLRKLKKAHSSSKIYVRASPHLQRLLASSIALARGAHVKNIQVSVLPIDPLFFPELVYHYTLPDSSVAERQARYESKLDQVQKVSKSITKVFGVPLPTETKITKNNVTGLLEIENVFSQEPPMSLYANIDLGMTKKTRKKISEGIVIRQYVDNIPLYVAQTSSLLAYYLLQQLRKNNGALHVLIGRDNNVSALASLLGYSFAVPNWPKNFVNISSGLLFTYDDEIDQVSVLCLGLSTKKKFLETEIAGKQGMTLERFTSFVLSNVSPQFINLSDVYKVVQKRVS